MKTLTILALLFLTACGNECRLYDDGIAIGFEFADPADFDNYTFAKMPYQQAIDSRQAQFDSDTAYVASHYADLAAALATKDRHAIRVTYFNQLELDFAAFKAQQPVPYPFYDCH